MSVIVKGFGENARVLVKGFGLGILGQIIIKIVYIWSKITSVINIDERR